MKPHSDHVLTHLFGIYLNLCCCHYDNYILFVTEVQGLRPFNTSFKDYVGDEIEESITLPFHLQNFGCVRCHLLSQPSDKGRISPRVVRRNTR